MAKLSRDVAWTMLGRIYEQGRPVPPSSHVPNYLKGFHDCIMPDGTRVPAAEVRRLSYIAEAAWNGGRPGLPWDELLATAAARMGDNNGLHGRKLRQVCTATLIAEITARGLKVPKERTLRTQAKALAARYQVLLLPK
jgi:hypothetical protein